MAGLTFPLLHLSIPVSDLDRSLGFYEGLGGGPGRRASDWADVWVFGGQITLFENPTLAARAPEMGRTHFGATLDKAEWEGLAERLDGSDSVVRGPLSEPAAGGVQHKLYLRDPDGWIVELKAYDDPDAALRRLA
ncbi:VOC family protein [Brevundimonas sp. 2R-24]|uniref:VOC family protein n=1 Tax=Peiella sedimenti TaxID=3061083 RepID=A0ABT8SLE8_9CAUL|nr:VOC family protein [Caulobacteraceae bacterium XZ-24]